MKYSPLKLLLILFLLLLQNQSTQFHNREQSRTPASNKLQNCNELILRIIGSKTRAIAIEQLDDKYAHEAINSSLTFYGRVEEVLGMVPEDGFNEKILSYSQIVYSDLFPLTSRESTPIENTLKNLDFVEKEILTGGANHTYLITLEDGTHAVWKPHEEIWHSNYRAEVLAYEIDSLFDFGIVPPTVERTIDGKKGSLQLFVENSGKGNDSISKKEINKQSFFDFIIDNRDRHSFNYFPTAGNHVASIDNGLSFTGKGYHGRPFSYRKEEIDKFLKSREGKRIIKLFEELDFPSFRRKITEYLGERDTALMIRRIKFILLYNETI